MPSKGAPQAGRSNGQPFLDKQALKSVEARVNRLGKRLASSDGETLTLENVAEALCMVLDVIADVIKADPIPTEPRIRPLR